MSLIVVSSRRSQVIAVVSFAVALMLLGAIYVGLMVRLIRASSGN